MGTLEYGPHGLIGLLTPQANATAETEFWIMAPTGLSLLTGRLTSPAAAMNERLIYYLEQLDASLDQFADAPLSAAAFACTGSSYLVGQAREEAIIEQVQSRRRLAVVTAAQALCLALRTLGARRLGLVSPYAPDLTEAGLEYWRRAGFYVAQVEPVAAHSPDGFHPIYTISARAVARAASRLNQSVDAIVLLGTGAPTLGAALELGSRPGPPILSSMLCLAWASLICAGRRPADACSLAAWLSGEDWRAAFAARSPPPEASRGARASASPALTKPSALKSGDAPWP
jgi:maleate isomerase